jgi:RecJ-like exonuclease
MTIEMKHKLIEAIVNDDKVGAIRILMDEPQDKLDRVLLENLKTEVSQLRAEVKDLKECFNTLGSKPKKVCARCGKEIGGNRKFCEECAKESQKEAKMKYYYTGYSCCGWIPVEDGGGKWMYFATVEEYKEAYAEALCP